MVVKNKEEIREILFKILSRTDLKKHLESEGKRLSDIRESIDEFLDIRFTINTLTKEGKLKNLEITTLTKKFVTCVSSNEVVQNLSFADIAKFCTAKFWRDVHAECAGTSYEYSFSCKDRTPILVIKDKGNNNVFQIIGFDYIGELMKSLIEDIDDFMLEYPQENSEISFWCYDALDFHESSKKVKKETIYINLSERLMLIEFINKNLLEACTYKPDKDKEAKFEKKELKITSPEKVTMQILEEADQAGFVTL